jgi:hypothetical protein
MVKTGELSLCFFSLITLNKKITSGYFNKQGRIIDFMRLLWLQILI